MMVSSAAAPPGAACLQKQVNHIVCAAKVSIGQRTIDLQMKSTRAGVTFRMQAAHDTICLILHWLAGPSRLHNAMQLESCYLATTHSKRIDTTHKRTHNC